MINLLRNTQRSHVTLGQQEAWHSFVVQTPPGPFACGIGSLFAFDEVRLPPGDSTTPHGSGDVELVTYVYRGALSQHDTMGYTGVLCAGEFQRVSAGGRIRQTETSVSQADWVHWFRMSLRPWQAGIDYGHEQQRFTAGQRRNQLCVVASPDRRKGSLRVHQDALIFSAMFEPGHHVVHELKTGRSAWIQVVHGAAQLDDVLLTLGDGVGVVDERSIALTVQDHTEILLIDMGPIDTRTMPRVDRGAQSCSVI